MSSHPETSPTNLTWQEVIIFSLSKCMVGRKIHTLNRGQAIECKLSLSAWIPSLNQNPNKVLSPLQATLWIAKALTIKRIFLFFVFLICGSSPIYIISWSMLVFPPQNFVVPSIVGRFWSDLYFDLEFPFWTNLR